MTHFRNLDHVEAFVLEHGREELEHQLRSGRIGGAENRTWAQAWIDRDDALNVDLISAIAELRRERDLRLYEESTEGRAAATKSATHLARWALVVAAASVAIALVAVYFAYF